MRFDICWHVLATKAEHLLTQSCTTRDYSMVAGLRHASRTRTRIHRVAHFLGIQASLYLRLILKRTSTAHRKRAAKSHALLVFRYGRKVPASIRHTKCTSMSIIQVRKARLSTHNWMTDIGTRGPQDDPPPHVAKWLFAPNCAYLDAASTRYVKIFHGLGEG